MGTETATTERQAKPPVHEIRLGYIKGTIWSHDTERGQRFSVTFSRIYQTEGDWQKTNFFGRDDLLVLGKVADHCHSWILEAGKRDAQQRKRAAADPGLSDASMPKAKRSQRQKDAN